MQKIMIMLGVFFVLAFSFSAGTLYAIQQEPPQGEAEGSTVTRLLEAANERLFAEVQALLKENAQLKNDKIQLQGEVSSAKRDRQEVFDKLKMVSEDNARLEDRLLYLESQVSSLDDAKKALENANKQIEQMKDQLEKEAQSSAETKKELQKYKEMVQEPKARTAHERKREKINFAKTAQQQVQRPKQQGMRQKAQTASSRIQRGRGVDIEGIKQAEENLGKALGEIPPFGDLSRLKKEVADMHYNMGVIFQQQNRPEEALREYNMVLKIKPDDADAHFNIGLIYETVKNDRVKAIYHYTRYLDLRPDAEDAQKIKECITNLKTQLGVWGHPDTKGIGQKEKLGRP